MLVGRPSKRLLQYSRSQCVHYGGCSGAQKEIDWRFIFLVEWMELDNKICKSREDGKEIKESRMALEALEKTRVPFPR